MLSPKFATAYSAGALVLSALASASTTAIAWKVMHPHVFNVHDEYERASHSAVVIAIRADKAPKGWLDCSGTLIDKSKRLVLTAHHCIQPDAETHCFFITDRPSYRLAPSDIARLSLNGDSLCSLVLDAPDSDLAVFRIDSELPPNTAAQNVASQDVEVGAAVHGVNAPHALANTWFQGYVTNVMAHTTVMEGVPDFQPRTIFSFSAPTSKGESGGMVLNEQGELVGLIVAGSKDAGAVGYAVPASIIREKLAQLAAKSPAEATR